MFVVMCWTRLRIATTIFTMVGICIGLWWLMPPVIASPAEVITYSGMGQSLWAALLPSHKELLAGGIPLLEALGGKTDQGVLTPVQGGHAATPTGLWGMVTRTVLNVDLSVPRTYLSAGLPLLALHSANRSIPATATIPVVFTHTAGDVLPLVAVYHTHTSENFSTSAGTAHAPGGQCGDIVTAGEHLAATLQQQYHITSVQSKTVHDYPSFMKAYGASEKTIKQLCSQYPSLQMVFDIHRDAAEREQTTMVIQGKSAARIKIVVATGHKDLPQPHYQQNHDFAKGLEQRLNAQYPGLCLGIVLEDWRYNQHVHPHALLLEVGSHENTLDEANYTMELLAQVLASWLNGN